MSRYLASSMALTDLLTCFITLPIRYSDNHMAMIAMCSGEILVSSLVSFIMLPTAPFNVKASRRHRT